MTDEGVAAFAVVLNEILQSKGGATRAQLQFLRLKSNCLTTKALASLAPCIEAAADQLVEVDLSCNNIKVDTEASHAEFKAFFRSFRPCTALRRLVLSSNDLSATRAFEIIAQEYSRQFEFFFLQWQDENDSDEDVDDVGAVAPAMNALSVRDTNIQHNSADIKGKARTKAQEAHVLGLPSIQCISLDDVGMTDAGALFLSSVIERHQWTQVKVCGNIWSDSRVDPDRATIAVDGNLDLTEFGQNLLVGAVTNTFDPLQDAIKERRPSTPNKARSELENYRKRVRYNIIERRGVSHVCLWLTALRMLRLVRNILSPAASDRHFPVVRLTGSIVPIKSHPKPLSMRPKSRPSTPKKDHSGIRSYASVLRGVATVAPSSETPEAVEAMGIYSESRTQIEFDMPFAAENADDAPPMEELTKNAYSVETEEPNLEKGQILPRSLWIRIFKLVIDPDGVLSDRHINAIVAYGTDKQTIASERRLIGSSDSVQIFKVLESMDSLTY